MSKNNEEDFGIYDYEEGKLTTYMNAPNFGQNIFMTKGSTYLIKDWVWTKKEKLHSAIMSQDGKFLILVDQNNIYKYDIK